MKVIVGTDAPIELGATETTPTIGIADYSRRETDDFGVTTVVERGFSRRMSVRMALPFEEVDGVQRLLADLRTTSALWIADDDIEWLKPTGFYKDFEVDLNVPPLSFCTLTVEGLAESAAVADAGADPAPEGSDSTLRMLLPTVMTDAVLTSSSVAENDAPVWGAGITYPLGGRVIRTGSHRIYESLGAGNIGHDPLTSPANWVDVGPTNRWAMFDEALGTVTSSGTGSIVVTFDAGPVGAVALLDVVGSSVQVEVIATGDVDPTYDQTIATDGGTIRFLDLPGIAGTVRVTIAGVGTVSVGTLLIGDLVGLGITEASPTAGITDFSRKVVDDFGEVSIVERAWAKRMSARALIRTDAIDVVADRIAAVRARPVLWMGDAGLDSLTVYGFFRDFSIEAGETVSKLSLSIEGLSKAQPLKAPWADDVAAVQAKVDRIASDGYLSAGEKPQAELDWNALVANFNALNDRYLALGSPSDITPSRNDADAALDALGVYLSGLAPSWSDTTQDTPIDPAVYQQKWVDAYTAVAQFQAAITGRVGGGGDPGLNNAIVFAFKRSATAPAGPSATATYTFGTGAITGLNNGWSASVPTSDGNPLWVIAATASAATATDTIAAGEWASPVIQAQDGATGAAGLNAATVFLFQRNDTGVAPGAPSVATTYTFATGLLSGVNNGWTQTVPAASGGRYLYVTTAAALGNGATDTILASEWATVRQMAQDGGAGLNNAIVFAFKRSATAPANPSVTATYTFASGALTGLNNGWSASVPAADGNPLWVIAATASASGVSDTIAAAEWSSPVIQAQDGGQGAAGLNAATVFLFQRNDTGLAPVAPSLTTTYTFSTGALAGVNNGWSQTVPAASGGKYLFVTTATALSNGTTDTIAAGEWATVRQMAQDGATGAPGLNNAVVFAYQRSSSGAPPLPSAAATYTFSTRTLTGLNNGWTATIPAGTAPLYVTAATASSATDTDAIGAGEWASAQILAQTGADGSPGLNSATVFLFQRNNTGAAPAAPSVTTTYTFSTGVLAGVNNGWTQAAPDPAGGKYLFITTATALGTGATDTIATGEWAAVKQVVKDGDTGAAGAPGLTISADKPLLTVARTATGVIKASQLPQTVQLKVLSGDVDVTASTTFSNATGTNSTASNNGGGSYTLTSVSDPNTASFKVTATYAGKSMDYTVQIAQPKDGGSSSRNTAANGAPNSSGTYVQIGFVDLVVAAGATINASGGLGYNAVDNGVGTRTVTLTAYMDVYNLTDGGTPTNGPEAPGSQAQYIHLDGPSDVGSVSAGVSMTNGTGVPKTFRARFYTKKTDGNSTADTTAGMYSGNLEITAS